MDNNTFRLSFLILVLTTLDSSVFAHRPIFSDKAATDPLTAIRIDNPAISQVVYRELTQKSPYLWFDFEVEKEFDLFVQIGIPKLARFSEYRPAVAVLGPGLPNKTLPFDIPEGVGAHVLLTDDVTQPRAFYEPFTRTNSWILRSETLHLKNAGHYYVVAFSPKQQWGKLWLAVGKKESFGLTDWLRFGGWSEKIRAFHEVSTQENVSRTTGAKEESPGDLVAELTSMGRFQTLLAAVTAAGFLEMLQSEEVFTVFAPTDEAFGSLPESALEELLRPQNREQLQDLLKAHVVPGRLYLHSRQSETMSDEAHLTILGAGPLRVNNAEVISSDIPAKNGLIHVVDSVITVNPKMEEQSQIVQQYIETAIRWGVPMFNSGEISACNAIYESTLRGLKQFYSNVLSPSERARIEQISTKKIESEQMRERAWRLREIMDEIYNRLRGTTQKSMQVDSGTLLIDDFARTDGVSIFGTKWRTVTDQVMGGVSNARSNYETQRGDRYLCLKGTVSLKNNGGFIQVSLPLMVNKIPLNASKYKGIRLRVKGNGELYYVHLKTIATSLPWQYYTAEFKTTDQFRTIDIPFDSFEPQSLSKKLDSAGLVRIALVGAKKEFQADLCISRVELY